MKKIISLLLLLALTFTLASCDMLGGGKDDTTAYGLIASGDKSYFVTPNGTIEISGGAAKVAASAPEGTPVSKKFDAPNTADIAFTTEATDTGVKITGVSGADVVIIPNTIGSKKVTGVAAGALNGVKSVIFATPAAAMNIDNGALKGVTNVYIASTPDLLGVGAKLLENTSGVNIYISADELSNFKVHYNWGTHASNLKKF